MVTVKIKAHGLDVSLLRPPYPPQVLVREDALFGRSAADGSPQYAKWAQVAAEHGSLIYPFMYGIPKGEQQSRLHQSLNRLGLRFNTRQVGPGKLAVIVHSIPVKEAAKRPTLSFFEPMVTRDPSDRQAAIRVLSDESAVLFWTLPQARLERFQDGDFPLRPRPEHLSLRRREYLSWLEAADQGTTVLWPLVVDTSWQPGKERKNFTVNAQATALHSVAKKMMLRIQTRLFDDDFLALRIRASQEA